MDITVKHNFVRISPRKSRPVLHGMRGANAEKTLDILRFTNRKASAFLFQLLKSGIAAAKESDIEAKDLFIKSVVCNEGPRLKRRRFWSKGQSRRITKRMSHFVLTLTNEPITEKSKSKDHSDKKEVDGN